VCVRQEKKSVCMQQKALPTVLEVEGNPVCVRKERKTVCRRLKAHPTLPKAEEPLWVWVPKKYFTVKALEGGSKKLWPPPAPPPPSNAVRSDP